MLASMGFVDSLKMLSFVKVFGIVLELVQIQVLNYQDHLFLAISIKKAAFSSTENTPFRRPSDIGTRNR